LLQTRIFALMVIVIVGALGVALWVARRVVAPIQTLTAATRRITAGDLDSPLQVREQDEIGLLARSLDSMRVRLKDSMAEIQAWNSELNTRVQARTAEYREARAEIEQLYIELQHKEHTRRELLHRVISTQEEERKRIELDEDDVVINSDESFPASDQRWSRLSEQIFRVDKWSVCRG
jgi:nitrate/nitrite-specific signal transduction histidine kinase